MLSSSCCFCCHRTKVDVGDHEHEGEYVQISEKKKIFVLHYKIIKNEVSDVNIDTKLKNKGVTSEEDRVKTNDKIDDSNVNLEAIKNSCQFNNNAFLNDNGQFLRKEVSSTDISDNFVNFVKFTETKEVFVDQSISNKSIITGVDVGIKNTVIEMEEDKKNVGFKNESSSNVEALDMSADFNENFKHLGVYDSCKYELMKPDYIVNFNRPELDKKCGFTIISKKRFKMLYKKISNNAETPLLFFIHGVGGCTKIWQKQISYFIEKGYEIVIPDLLGHGKSTKDNDEKSYLFENLAKDILFVFDKYKKNKNVVIGHSYGCSFTTYLGKMRADVIDKIILISGGV